MQHNFSTGLYLRGGDTGAGHQLALAIHMVVAHIQYPIIIDFGYEMSLNYLSPGVLATDYISLLLVVKYRFLGDVAATGGALGAKFFIVVVHKACQSSNG